MAILHERDHDVSDYRERSRTDQEDREISLGTGTILGIFFALALLCAIFFGIGYSTGRKSAQTALTTATPQTTNPANTASLFSSAKPSAGSQVETPVQAATNPKAEAQEAAAQAPHDPDSEIVTNPVTAAAANTPKPAPRVLPAKADDAGSPAMPAINPNGTSMVQVAAVSHQEDADTLIAALKKKGYTVFIRKETQDRLLHVQLGPFGTRKDADLMRQHLLADGYNAIVK